MSTVSFVDFGASEDADSLYQSEGLPVLQDAIEDYDPPASSLDVLILQGVARQQAAASAPAGDVGAAIFDKFGELLVGVQRDVGAGASLPVQLSVSAGTVDINPGDYITDDGDILTPSTTGSFASPAALTFNRQTLGADKNGQPPTALQPMPGAAWAIDTAGSYANGADPEDDTTFLTRLANELQLLTLTPVTASDYANFLVNYPIPAPDGAAGNIPVDFAVALDGYNASLSVTSNVTATASSNQITVSTITGIGIGTVLPSSQATSIFGAGDVYIIGQSTAATNVFTVSKAATTAATATAKTFNGTFGNSRTITGIVYSGEGTLSSDDLAQIAAYVNGGVGPDGTSFPGVREIGFDLIVQQAVAVPVAINSSVVVTTGADPSAVQTLVLASLNTLLTPDQYFTQDAASGSYVIHGSQVVRAIMDTEGVAYIKDSTTTIGGASGSFTVAGIGNYPTLSTSSVITCTVS